MRSRLLLLAILATALALAGPASAAPTPSEAGWTARMVASGFGLNFNGIAYDPLSTDLFVTDFNNMTIYRVTQTGVKTPIYSATDIQFDEMAFDPVARILYFGGVNQTAMRKITDLGVLIETVMAPQAYTGLALGPDGNLYLNFNIFSPSATSSIARYNPVDDSFTIVHPDISTPNLEGLSYDAAGNAYVADYSSNRALQVTPGGVVTNLGVIAAPIGSTFGDGSMFATNWSTNIFRVAPDGSGVTTFATGHVGVAGITFAANGCLYVNDANAGSIWEYCHMPVPARAVTWGAVKAGYR